MRIEQIRKEEKGDTVRTVASVIWEDSARGQQDVYFETTQQFGDGLAIEPEAFLVACALPAMRHGERRLMIDRPICPQLRLGLNTALSLVRFWYDATRQPVRIEASAKSEVPRPQADARAAFFFTGGVDSLTTLRLNRQYFPEQHSGYYRDGLLIFGLEVDRLDSFQCVTDVLSVLATDAGITLLPVFTNVRSLEADWTFWTDEFESAVLASTAHALSLRIGSAAIGSTFNYPHLHPHGSHPLLDPNYSSSRVQIRHDGVALSRLSKIRLLADWDAGLKALRVCNQSDAYRPGLLNCGQCEKCVRTLTALLILGKLDHAVGFVKREVTPALIEHNVVLNKTSYPFWDELVEPLRQRGRHDLAAAINKATTRYRRRGGWKASIARFDERHFHGAFRQVKRRTMGQPMAIVCT